MELRDYSYGKMLTTIISRTPVYNNTHLSISSSVDLNLFSRFASHFKASEFLHKEVNNIALIKLPSVENVTFGTS